MKKTNRTLKKKLSTPLVTAIAATLAIGTCLVWFNAKQTTPLPVPLYEVTRVFDGDTFETKEKQYIRVSGIDAPEMGRCGSEEAKKELERLVMKKPVYIKILYHLGSREAGLVYTDDGSVGTNMLKSGWAVKYDRDTPNDPTMQQATDDARNKKLGIFSSLCTQAENVSKPACNIKGNNPYRDETKTYHMPNCPTYAQTVVQLYKGDEWFCSEQEAIAAGYTKAHGCVEK